MPEQYELIPAKKQGFTVIHNRKSLHSRIDPIQEAARWVEKQNLDKADIFIITETGLGYLISPLLKRINQEMDNGRIQRIKAIFFINERDNLFQLGLEKKIIPHDLQSEFPLFLLDPSSAHKISTFLENIDILGSKGYRVLKTSIPSDSSVIVNELLSGISSRLSDLLTRIEFEKMWVKNIITNSLQLHKGKAVKFLFGKFQKKPACIIGAGPTLIDFVPQLQLLQKKSIIVATDTSLKILLSQGIRPHFVYTLDSQRHSLRHFLHAVNDYQELCKEITLVADLVSRPEIIRLWPGKVLYANTAKYIEENGKEIRVATPMSEWVERLSTHVGDIQSGGSVATSAFDFVRQLACEPILFLGQDLAYVGREIHSRGTHHNNGWLAQTNRLLNLDDINQRVINKRTIKKISSLSNGETVTDYVFDMYRMWFNDAFMRTGLEIIFPRSKGAKLENISILSPDEMQDFIDKLPEEEFSEEIKKFSLQAEPILSEKISVHLCKLYKKTKSWLSAINIDVDYQAFAQSRNELLREFPFMEIFFRKADLALGRGKISRDDFMSSSIMQEIRRDIFRLLIDLNKSLLVINYKCQD